MPLPENNSIWPARPWDAAQDRYSINEAWYLGDTDKLARLYSASGETRATHRRAGQDMKGGVVGALSRFFWGRPIPQDQHRTRLHLPAPADLAVLSSDLMFAEPPEVRLASAAPSSTAAAGAANTIQDRLDRIANSPEAHSTWHTMGELKSVFGACAVVTRWDKELADHPWLQVQAADVIVPEFRMGRLSALTLWSEWSDGTHVVYRHLERHEPGRILHALYRGTEARLGMQVPLQEQPQTESYAALVDADGAIPTGIDRLTASYNINLPTREWRRKGDLAYAGRSDFQGILPLFDTLDEVWSSWVRDIRLARARLVVPESFLDYSGPGNAAQFDADQEIFSPVAAMYRPGESSIDLHQPLIRVEEHERTVYAVYREILRAAGFSSASWGEYSTGSGSGAVTATEVTDRTSASERTRDKKALYDRRAIAEQAAAALAIDAQVFGGISFDGKELPEVTFPPVSQIDQEKNSRTLGNLRAASLMTIRTGVETAHPDWDEDRIKQEVDGIMAERGQTVPDPAELTE